MTGSTLTTLSRAPQLWARVSGIVAMLMVIVALAWWAGRGVYESRIWSLAAEADRSLELIVANLEGALARYESMPRLLALDPRFNQFLRNGAPQSEAVAVNRLLVQVNQVMGALDTYLLDRQGLTVAASNWQSERPFVGQNFSYRPYFQEAMLGRASRYFALGTTSNRRGYYFAFPLMHEGTPEGAIVVKAPVEHLETYWASGGRQVLVLDENGVVFLSSRPEFWFRSLAPLEATARLRLADTRRYGDGPIESVSLERESSAPAGSLLRFDEAFDESGPPRWWLERSHEMREAGWRVMLLSDTTAARSDRLRAMLLTAFVGGLALVLGMLLYDRRRRMRREAQSAVQARALLERRVDERTRALGLANARLRRTRGDLLRQERLAALGQVSAGIGHELTQPLTALHGYVQNALGFLAREQPQRVRENLERIDTLGSRIDGVVRHLKSLVSGQPLPVEPVDATTLIADIIEDARSGSLAEGVALVGPPSEPVLWVTASEVGLRQVLTNLVTNALEAVSEQAAGQVQVRVRDVDGVVEFSVTDNGPGFGDTEPESAFRAFYTTKANGQGLGLAIVRASLERMGSAIHAEQNPGGGAAFHFRLPRAQRPPSATQGPANHTVDDHA